MSVIPGATTVTVDAFGKKLAAQCPAEGDEVQVLDPVERWDLDHGTDLLQTLRAFLMNGGRWRATATHLHIHHNTLRYRLRRVELLTGRQLDEVADRLDLQIALLVPRP